MNIHRLFLPALLFCLLTATGAAQTLKLGFVNSAKIFEDLPEAQKIRKDLETKLSAWRDTLEMMSKDFQQKVETFQQQQSGPMTDAAKQQRLQELSKEERQLREFESAKQAEAQALQAKTTAPLKEKILKAIEEVAQKEKLNFIFDKAQDSPVMLLLYADVKFDYTNLVLDYLKRGSK